MRFIKAHVQNNKWPECLSIRCAISDKVTAAAAANKIATRKEMKTKTERNKTMRNTIRNARVEKCGALQMCDKKRDVAKKKNIYVVLSKTEQSERKRQIEKIKQVQQTAHILV